MDDPLIVNCDVNADVLTKTGLLSILIVSVIVGQFLFQFILPIDKVSTIISCMSIELRATVCMRIYLDLTGFFLANPAKLPQKLNFASQVTISLLLPRLSLYHRCQFHQHFTWAFFIQKSFSLVMLRQKALSYEKCLRKMLMKLTPGYAM